MAHNKNCIIRISRYKNALNRLRELGFVKVFSNNLADAAGTTPVQVRKDFSLFGITGNRRGGYQVEELIEKVNDILGKNGLQKVVLVGVGNIGRALLRYKGFEVGGIKIIAGFDIDPVQYTRDAEVPVFPMEQFRAYVQEHDVKIGILAVPDVAAHHISEIMASAGIKGILNFAPIQLRTSEDIIVSNINLEVELENLIYFVNAQTKEEKTAIR